jgi:glutamyl-tRNA reductase
LSEITDETLENRKLFIPAAEEIISEVLTEFLTWSKGRKYAPTIHALKAKLNAIKESEINYLKKKNADFNEEYTEIVTAKLIQKITSHFANHLKDDNTVVDESVEWINKVFQISPLTPKGGIPKKEFNEQEK